MESGNIISPTDTVSNDVRIAFRFINSWNIANQLDYWKNDIKKYKLLIDNGYLENNTIWYSKPDKKFKKQIRVGTNSTLGDYIVFNFNYDYEVIGQIVYYVDTDTISTGTDTHVSRKLTRDKNNVLSYSAIKLSSDPTEPMQIATKHYVDNSIAAGGSDISLGLTSAAVGQTIKVKAVDESGKPTEWEAANMPSGGGTSEEFILLAEVTLEEAVKQVTLSLSSPTKHFIARMWCPQTSAASDPQYINIGINGNISNLLYYLGGGRLPSKDNKSQCTVEAHSLNDGNWAISAYTNIGDAEGTVTNYNQNARIPIGIKNNGIMQAESVVFDVVTNDATQYFPVGSILRVWGV